jgi:hypothetical protein
VTVQILDSDSKRKISATFMMGYFISFLRYELLESENHKDDLKKTLNEIFEVISEKIQRGGESFLEISYLCGGLISLTETEETIPADKQKYEIIIAHLLTILELNLCWSDLNKIIDDLTSGKIQSRRESRDQLFSLICGSQTRHKKVFEIQNLFETNSSYQNTAFA